MREANSRAATTAALFVDAGAFKEKEQFVRESLRLDVTGLAAESYEPFALTRLVLLDHDARGVILFRNLDGGIGHRATAIRYLAEILAHQGDPGIDLTFRIARMRALYILIPALRHSS